MMWYDPKGLWAKNRVAYELSMAKQNRAFAAATLLRN